MKRMVIAAGVALAMLMSGCATDGRPKTGPGSGRGADYVPLVEKANPSDAAYNTAVAKCQRWARDLPFRPSGEHDVAIGVLALASAVAIGNGPVDGIYEVFYLAGVGAGWYGFREWVYAPERQAWHARQETTMMNCMAREGYSNLDPSVRVTWTPFRSADRVFRLTGRDTYNAEQYAKAQRCAAVPIASMVSKGPGYETYTVACDGGATLTVRCEFGHCRSSQPVALLTPDRRRLP